MRETLKRELRLWWIEVVDLSIFLILITMLSICMVAIPIGLITIIKWIF